jgi:beta-N-acetylhexosaminidase
MDEIAQESVTLIAPEGSAAPLVGATGPILVAGTGTTAVPAMAAALTTRGLQTTSMVTGFGADESVISGAVSAARTASAVVLLTYDVFRDSGQKKLIRRLTTMGVPVIVVPVNGPYDAAWADGAAAVITSYGYTPTNLDAVAGALMGGQTPGVLPVTVPDTGAPPRAVLYPRGWGLSWTG